MRYVVWAIQNQRVIDAISIDSDDETGALDIAESLREADLFDASVKLVISDTKGGIGDYYIDGEIVYPEFKYFAVLNDSDYCIAIKEALPDYVENEDEQPIAVCSEVYLGAYFDGDKWDFDNKMDIPSLNQEGVL